MPNRGGYLMAIGRPAAQVGLYHPGNSIWMGDQEADRSTTKLGWQLFEHQVDWDYFDEQSLSSVAAIENGGFKNLSGQVYKAIVFPSMSVITRTGLARLQAFVKAGGKAIFVGKTPGLIVDQTFLNAKDVPDLSFATLMEPSGDITARVLAALPKPDVKLDAEFPRLTYTHRSWRDAEMYYFFNESNKAESRMATVAGRGQAQDWDLSTGEIHPLAAATAEGDSVRFPLVLGPYEAKVVVVGPLPAGVGAAEPSFAAGNTLVELSGDWTVGLNGKQVTTTLKSWEDLGAPSFAGPATYRTHFTASPNARRETGVSGNWRCERLRARETERETVGGPRLAALPLGCDRCRPTRQQRARGGGTHHCRRARGWCASPGCRTRSPSRWRAGRQGARCRNCGACPTGSRKRPNCRAAAYGLAGPGTAGGAVRFRRRRRLIQTLADKFRGLIPCIDKRCAGVNMTAGLGSKHHLSHFAAPPFAAFCGSRCPPAQGRFFSRLRARERLI